MILWDTSSPPFWSAGFPNKVTIPCPKTSSFCPMTRNMRLDSKPIHETLAEVSFIVDKIHRRHAHNWYLWFKEDMQMANRHMKRCSALLISRERQIDTARRYHLIAIRMAIIRKLMNNMLERVWRRGKPSYTVGGVETGAVTTKNNMEVPQKMKNRVSI